MTHPEQFPNLGRSFQLMKLQDQLDAISDQSIMGLCIKSAMMKKTPLRIIARTIIDSYHHNPTATINIVGDETISLIWSLYS